MFIYLLVSYFIHLTKSNVVFGLMLENQVKFKYICDVAFVYIFLPSRKS